MTTATFSTKDQLCAAFAEFEDASLQLSSFYQDLERQVGRLTTELTQSRAGQARELAEKQRLAARLENLLAALPGGVVVLDQHGLVQEFNPAATDLLGDIRRGEGWAVMTAQLPWTWRVDAASPVLRGERFTLRGMVEARQWSGGLATGVLAAEGTWRDGTTGAVLAARAGYALRGSGDDRSPMTVGGGVTLGRFSVDYAYEGFELLGGATHRVGIRYAAARVVTAH